MMMLDKFKKNTSMTIAVTAVCIVIGIVTAVQFNTMAGNKENTSEQNKTLEELRVQLLHEIDVKNSMEDEIKRLTEKIEILEKGSLSEQSEFLKEEYKKAQTIAGLNNVNGPGIVITIGENANMMLGVDKLLQLINDLRMAEAQAISINGERVVAMTDIAVGGYVMLVNGNPVMAPYTIKAIGDQDKMETMLNVPLGIISQLEMGDWLVRIERVSEVQIPKIKDDSKSIKTDLIKEGTGS